jgi:excisionase family DNA binding protein
MPPYTPPNTPPEESLLTPREVAEMLGVRVTTVGRWARTGVLKPVARTPGGHRRYDRTDVRALQEAAEYGTGPERRQLEQDAVRLYQQGWSIRQVAARFGLSYGAMRRLLLRRTPLRTKEGGRP